MSYTVQNTKIVGGVSRPVNVANRLLRPAESLVLTDAAYEVCKGQIKTLEERGYIYCKKNVEAPPAPAPAAPPAAPPTPAAPVAIEPNPAPVVAPVAAPAPAVETKAVEEPHETGIRELKRLCKEHGIEYSKADGVAELKEKLAAAGVK
jgi:hypothetical protein